MRPAPTSPSPVDEFVSEHSYCLQMLTTATRIFSSTVRLRLNGFSGCTSPTFFARRHINVPTAQHIVGIKRPERPAFFNEDATLHYVFAVPEDHDFLLEWELEHAMSPRFSPVPTIGEITRKEAAEFCSASISRGVNSGCSLLGFDGNELVVMSLNMIVTMPSHNHPLLTDADLPYQRLKEDYQEDIDKGPYSSPKLNAIHALLQALEEDVHLVFPPGARVLDLGRPTVVHKDYRRKGHGLEAQLLALKMGRDLLKCSHVYARLAIGKTTQMGQKLKKAEPEAAKVFRVIPYDKFRAGGRPVFTDCAGATEGMLFFADYKNIKNII